MPHLDDPRWAGQDSQSLPDRPAHPNPSKRAEFGDPEQTPSHGIFGHLEAKHGLVSEAELDADQARAAQVRVDALQSERDSVQARAETGDDRAKARLKGVDSALKAAKADAKGVEDPDLSGGAGVREAILAGEAVPSIESAGHVEGDSAGKRDDALAQNAMPAEKGAKS